MEIIEGDREHRGRCPGCRPHRIVTTEGLIGEHRQFRGIPERWGTSGGVAGRLADDLQTGAFDETSACRPSQHVGVEASVTGHQGHHRSVINGEDEGFDDGGHFTTDRGRGVGGGLGSFREAPYLDREPRGGGSLDDPL